ncbi:hypothetical protein JOD43_001516 [Pullulanibacillus pueri]|nr:hypothetical protein [Pullulanibacillus pueri]
MADALFVFTYKAIAHRLSWKRESEGLKGSIKSVIHY